jgi:hypothetical protein
MALSLLVALVSCPGPAVAQRVTETMTALETAQNAHSLGDNLAALNSIIEAEEAIWNNSPLGVRNAVFVTEQPDKFGYYTPKVGEDFTEDEPLILYCEPIGYTQPKGADGTYSISLLPSVQVIDSKGQVLGGEPQPAETMTGHRTFVKEHMLVSTVSIRGLPPGSYTLKLTLTDNNDPTKTVDIEKPFNWQPPSDS